MDEDGGKDQENEDAKKPMEETSYVKSLGPRADKPQELFLQTIITHHGVITLP